MARPPKRPSRGGAGGLVGPGHAQPSKSSAGAGLATRGADLHPPLDDGEDLAPHPDEVEDMEAELENDDDLREDAREFFGIDLGDQQPPIINLDGDGDDDGGVAASTDTRGTSTTGTGKRKSIVWTYFDEIKDENGLRSWCRMQTLSFSVFC